MGNSAFLQRPSKRSHERTSLLSGAYQIRIARREGSSGGQYPGSQSESSCVSKGLAQGPYAMARGGVRTRDLSIHDQRRYLGATAPHKWAHCQQLINRNLLSTVFTLVQLPLPVADALCRPIT